MNAILDTQATIAKMLCGTCVEPGQFTLMEYDLPTTAPPGWALVDISAVGICGTDYHIFEGLSLIHI